MIWRYAKKALIVLALIGLVGVSGLGIATKITGGKLLSVQTGSMVPKIRKGDLVVVKRVPISQLKVGDVITFINPTNQKETITHRIVAINMTPGTSHTITTKGDANRLADRSISVSAVVGKMQYKVPYLGHVLDFVRKPLGLVLIIYIPALAVIIEELKRLSAYYRSQQPYVAAGYEPHKHPKDSHSVTSEVVKFVIVAVITFLLVFAVRTHALLRSNPATLRGNRIFATRTVPPVCATTGNSTNVSITGAGGSDTPNNVNVSNSNNQSSSSGNAASNGGGTATTGNASNTNCANINITITNH